MYEMYDGKVMIFKFVRVRFGVVMVLLTIKLVFVVGFYHTALKKAKMMLYQPSH